MASEFGIDDRPTLVIFEKGIPNLYLGNLQNADEILIFPSNEPLFFASMKFYKKMFMHVVMGTKG